MSHGGILESQMSGPAALTMTTLTQGPSPGARSQKGLRQEPQSRKGPRQEPQSSKGPHQEPRSHKGPRLGFAHGSEGLAAGWRSKGVGGREPRRTSGAQQTGSRSIAEQPSAHLPPPTPPTSSIRGAVAVGGFVGWKIWVYVCTHTIWQRGCIQIQLRRTPFA